MKILPVEIPDDAAPLQESDIVPPPPFPSHMLAELNGKNVFVTIKKKPNSSGAEGSFVGILHDIQGGTFLVGNSPYRMFFSDVESFREV